MQTRDEVPSLNLLTPELIMQMPASLWRTLELASVLLNLEAQRAADEALRFVGHTCTSRHSTCSTSS